MPDHVITIRPGRKRGEYGVWYRAYCSCGNYKSTLRGSPGQAEQCGAAHVRSKETTP